MRTFMVSDNETLSGDLLKVLLREGHECQVSRLSPLEDVAKRLNQARPEMVVVVLSPNPEPALALLHEARNVTPDYVLAVGSATEPKLHLRAIREGADYYLDEEEAKEELEAILRRFHKPKETPPEESMKGRLIALLAPSGGSGSSTLAVNLAVLLAKEHKKCGLIDLSLGGGDLAALLDLKPAYTLSDLCENLPRMDRVMFEHSLSKHESGVALLSPSRSFADIEKVSSQGVRQALALARMLFPYVVVDLDDSFHAEQKQTLREADLVLLVLRLDFLSLRNARRTLEHLEQLEVKREKVRLVVNRYGQPEELPAGKAEQALGMKIAHYIPDDPKTINRAINMGIPAVMEAPSAKFSRSMTQLAEMCAETKIANGRKTQIQIT